MTKRLWYLSGGMTKFGSENYNLSNDWRKSLQEKIAYMSDGEVVCCNPNQHFSMITNPSEFTDREAMNIDIYKLRQSELMIYNNNDPYSRGSMIEFGIAWEKRIPILVLNYEKNELHPWVNSMAEKVFSDEQEFLWYLEDHYIRIN